MLLSDTFFHLPQPNISLSIVIKTLALFSARPPFSLVPLFISYILRYFPVTAFPKHLNARRAYVFAETGSCSIAPVPPEIGAERNLDSVICLQFLFPVECNVGTNVCDLNNYLLKQQSAISATGVRYWSVGVRPVAAAERAHVEAEAALERRHWPLHARSSRRFHLSAQAAKLARSSAKSVRLGIYQTRAPLRIYIESQLGGTLHFSNMCYVSNRQ